MRLKSILLFLVTVVVPTTLLSYFGLLAVRGERESVEGQLQQKYQSIAQIVLEEIDMALQTSPPGWRADAAALEALLLKQTLLFQEEVMIFDRENRAVDGHKPRTTYGTPTYVAGIPHLPYEIAVYERHPIRLHQMAEIKRRIATHTGTVGLCAIAILSGGIVTLWLLHREWGKTETKAEFLSHLAHELRRPLTSIRMFAEMLDRGRVPHEEKQKEYYRILLTESDKLIALIHSVLDISRIERGKKMLDMKVEDFTRVVTETVQRFQTYTDYQTHSVGLDVEAAARFAPLPVRMDANVISQALLNCLFNATKFSPPGSPINIAVSRDGKHAVVSVIDQGIGIPKRELKKIFEAYYRGQSSEVRNREGSGLGLALVKNAVEVHGGRLTVHSVEGTGSEFRIALPLHLS